MWEAVQVTRCAYLLPGEGLDAAEFAEHVIGIEPRVMQTLDSKIRSSDVAQDVMADWDEVMKKAGCKPAQPCPSPKGYGKDGGNDGYKGKGYGKDGNKGYGKDSNKGYGNKGGSKGYGK